MPTRVHGSPRAEMPSSPIVLLCPPRSYSSVVVALLGQHPQLYAMAENGLFFSDEMQEWRRRTMDRLHYWPGAVRTVASTLFGGVDGGGLVAAEAYLRSTDGPTTLVIEQIDFAVGPLQLVDKSPIERPSLEGLRSLAARWPGARFLHLVRHPYESVRSMMKFPTMANWAGSAAGVSAPLLWLGAHQVSMRLLDELPTHRGVSVRAEDVLLDPAGVLGPVLRAWGLRDDAEALADLPHPERSEWVARPDLGGADPGFLASPALRPPKEPPRQLLPPGAVRSSALDSEIASLARHFGYRVGD